MLNRFIILKVNNDIAFIDDFLLGLLGQNISIKRNNEIITIYHTLSDNEEIYGAFQALVADEMSELKVLISDEYQDIEKMDYDINILSKKLLNPNLAESIYLMKDFIMELILNEDKLDLDNVVLKNKSDEVIKVFIECDMNTTKASKKLYMHRNTLINKLDKFASETGYDVRSFKDAYIIYSLLKK